MNRQVLFIDYAKDGLCNYYEALSATYTIIRSNDVKEAISILYQNHKILSAILINNIRLIEGDTELLWKIHSNPIFSQIPIIVMTDQPDENCKMKY